MGGSTLPDNIPAHWKQCAPPMDHRDSCRNGGHCYTDGISEFCICFDGYGGRQCERLLEAIVFFDRALSPEQMASLCRIAFFISGCLLLMALSGWICCCMKHLNARQLYLQNRKLAHQNRALHAASQRQANSSVRLRAALGRARALLSVVDDDAEQHNNKEENNAKRKTMPSAAIGNGTATLRFVDEEKEAKHQQMNGYVVDGNAPGTTNNRLSSSSTSTLNLATTTVSSDDMPTTMAQQLQPAATPTEQMRELISEMHDELVKSGGDIESGIRGVGGGGEGGADCCGYAEEEIVLLEQQLGENNNGTGGVEGEVQQQSSTAAKVLWRLNSLLMRRRPSTTTTMKGRERMALASRDSRKKRVHAAAEGEKKTLLLLASPGMKCDNGTWH